MRKLWPARLRDDRATRSSRRRAGTAIRRGLARLTPPSRCEGIRVIPARRPAMDEVLQVRGLRRTFASDGAPVRALRGVDLALAQGEFAGVMGPSGCGKSTLLNLVAGLDTPTDGEVVVAGESLRGLDENARARMRRRHVGFVFQFFHLLGDMTALGNVALPAAMAGAPRREAERRSLDLLDLLGLGGPAPRPPPAPPRGPRPPPPAPPAPPQRPAVPLPPPPA